MMKQRWQLSGIILLAASLFGLLSPASSQAAGIQVVSAPSGSQLPLPGWDYINANKGVSADGRYALFASTDPAALGSVYNGRLQLNRRDLITQEVELVTSIDGGQTGLNSGVWQASFGMGNPGFNRPAENMISQEGRYIVFSAKIPELTGTNTLHTFRRDMLTGAVDLASAQDGNLIPVESAQEWSSRISADGRYILFMSNSPELPLPHYTGKPQIYRRDMQTLRTEIVYQADYPCGGGIAEALDISADGRYVLFRDDCTSKILRRDMQNQTSERACILDRDNNDTLAKMSADGRYIVFYGMDQNTDWQLYRHDMQTQRTELANIIDGTTTPSDFQPTAFGVSGDGRYISFYNGWSQVYRRDMDTQHTILISSPDGTTPAIGSNEHYGYNTLDTYLSFDGSTIVFTYNATNLAPPSDHPPVPAVYAWRKPPSPPPSTHADITTKVINGVTLTTINGQLVPYTEHVGKITSVFVFANVTGTDDWLLLNPLTGWRPWVDCNSTAFPYVMHESMPWVTDIALFYNADLSPFQGWPILFGYGVGSNETSACLDMFNNSRYTRVAIL